MTSIKELRLGYWSAIAVVVWVALFAIELVWYLIAPSAGANNFSYIVSLLLAPTYVAMIACVPGVSESGTRSFTRAALGLAAMYGVLCTGVYYLQLSVLRLGTFPASADALELIRYTPGSPAFALDMLGYTFLCLSTLALVPTITGKGVEKVLKIFCIINGVLALPTLVFPALKLSQAGPGSSASFGCLVLLAWCVLFLPIPVIYVTLFQRKLKAARGAAA